MIIFALLGCPQRAPHTCELQPGSAGAIDLTEVHSTRPRRWDHGEPKKLEQGVASFGGFLGLADADADGDEDLLFHRIVSSDQYGHNLVTTTHYWPNPIGIAPSRSRLLWGNSKTMGHLVPTGDINRDGFTDYFANVNSTRIKIVGVDVVDDWYAVPGPVRPEVGSLEESGAVLLLRLGTPASYEEAVSVAGAIDVTGDGWPDLVAHDRRDVMVHTGPLHKPLDHERPDVRIRFDWADVRPPRGPNRNSPGPVLTGADFNADGVADLVLDSGYDIHVVHAPLCGRHDDVRDVAAASLRPNFATKRRQARPSLPGDLNGDGYADLAVVRRFANDRDEVNPKRGENRVFAFFGGRESRWNYDDPDGVALPPRPQKDLLVRSPGPGSVDLNRDGYDEVLVMINDLSTHVAWGPLYGRQELAPLDVSEGDNMGLVEGRYDVTGDGVPDLLVGFGGRLLLYPALGAP